MFCTNCGHPLQDDAKFCVHCGSKIIKEEPVAPVVEEAAVPAEPAVVAAPVVAVEEVIAAVEDTAAVAVETAAQPVAEAAAEPVEAPAPVEEVSAQAERYYAPEPAYAPAAEPVIMTEPVPAAPAAPVVEPASAQAVREVVREVVRETVVTNFVPAYQMKTNRGMLKYFLLGIITLGIYPAVVMSHLTSDINIIASRYDGRKTMHYCAIVLFAAITLGIAPLVWIHRLCKRMGNELSRRGIDYKFGAGTFWGWGFFGSLIIVGPFIYIHKLMKAMNKLCANYNEKG